MCLCVFWVACVWVLGCCDLRLGSCFCWEGFCCLFRVGGWRLRLLVLVGSWFAGFALLDLVGYVVVIGLGLGRCGGFLRWWFYCFGFVLFMISCWMVFGLFLVFLFCFVIALVFVIVVFCKFSVVCWVVLCLLL